MLFASRLAKKYWDFFVITWYVVHFTTGRKPFLKVRAFPANQPYNHCIMSRLNEEVQLVPPSTLTVIAFCVVVYGCQTILNLPLQTFTLCPQRIVEHWEVYRILTHAFFHANFLHIALNMLSAFAISSAVEKRVGTVYHLFSTFMSIVMISMVYIAISLLFLVIGNNDLYLQHSVGFSGVLFHMLVLDVTSSSQPRSLFGIIEVPPLFYPFAL